MQDGSGDYADIQAAVDVAAHGDTVRIGPGQWDTFHTQQLPGWSEPVHVIALDWQDRDLTFMGSGLDVTMLGPSPLGPHEWHYKGIMTRDSYDAISNMAIAGIYVGIYDGGGGVDLTNTRFDDCGTGLCTFSPEGATVAACEFYDCANGVLCLGNGNDVHVSDCVFTGCWDGVDLQGAGQAAYSVVDCAFTQGKTAVQVVYGQATIQNCHATAMNGGGAVQESVFNITDYAQVDLENCSAQTTGCALRVGGFSRVTGTNLVLDGEYRVIGCYVDSEVSIHQSHLINGGGYTVEAYYYSCPESTYLDLTNNYWGTTDVAQIDEWIFIDRAHGPNCVVVDHLPLADGPVQTQREAWGGIKALFR
jgi:hypothetical protein